MRLLACCDVITELQQIDIFNVGLDYPLRIDVELQRPMSLEDAMGQAHSYELRKTLPDSAAPAGCIFSCATVHRASPKTPAATAAGSSTSAPPATPNAPLKAQVGVGQPLHPVVPEEMAQHRNAGLCYN
jgi:hypothetical protein